MTAVDASTRGRRNRVNGAFAEREVARWLRPWWPDACRAVRSTYPDPGDIDCTSPGLWWSVKNVQQERMSAWLAEMAEKKLNRIGLLVVRRRGCADPGRWWLWVTFHDFTELMGAAPPGAYAADDTAPIRVELRHVMPLLVHSNYAPEPKAVA